MQIWAAWLYLGGAAASASGLIWAWGKLAAAWQRRWPGHTLSPALAELRLKLSRTNPTPPVIHGKLEATLPGVTVGIPTVRFREMSQKSLGFDILQLEAGLAKQDERSASERRHVESQLAAMREELDRRDRESTREALRLPAGLAVLGAVAQATAALLVVIDLSIGP